MCRAIKGNRLNGGKRKIAGTQTADELEWDAGVFNCNNYLGCA